MTLHHSLLGRAAAAWFAANGKKPWSKGYRSYKEYQISRAIDKRLFQVDRLPKGYGHRLDERIIEYPWFFSRLPKGPGRLLDAGSVLNYAYLLEREPVTTKNIFISTLAPEAASYWQRSISYVFEDLRETCYKNHYFDWVVSLSTFEHIGLNNAMLYTDDQRKRENDSTAYLQVARELHRVLKPGGRAYLSVPFGQYRNHGWFQLFDGDMVDKLVEAFQPSHFTASYYRYTPKGWQIASRGEVANATYFDIRSKAPYAQDYAAAARAVVCLEIVT